jgi:hypothetical protein
MFRATVTSFRGHLRDGVQEVEQDVDVANGVHQGHGLQHPYDLDADRA